MRGLFVKMAAAMAMATAMLALRAPVSAFVGVSISSGSPIQAGVVRRAFSSPCGVSMLAARVDNVAAILLAGGVGKRMEADKPKQFLELQGKPVLQHSLDLFLSLNGVSQLILVLDEEYRDRFEELQKSEPRLVFADPGKERQDSVYNALQKVDDGASVVCVHDAARPLVTKSCVRKVIADGHEHGAAVLGVLMKATVKESEDGEFVQRTIDRSRLWDIQTPQVVKPDILRRGFEQAKSEGWEVTDDVSIVEQLDLPVKLTKGEYTNLKLTTPDDLVVASQILETRRREDKDGVEHALDNLDEDDYLSAKRANAKWADSPCGEQGVSENDPDYEIDLSNQRANEVWSTDGYEGNEEQLESDLDFEEDFSGMRADEVWSDTPQGNQAVGEFDPDFEIDLSNQRSNAKWT